MGVLCAIFMVGFFDRVTLSVALAVKDFQVYFNLTDKDRGMLSAAFFWTYASLMIPAGWVVDRVGARNALGIGFVIWSLVSAGTGLAQTFGQLFAIRLLLGMGETIVAPAGMRWIRFNFPEERRGLAIGLFQAAAKVGPALGTSIAAGLILTAGWRWMFVIIGMGGLAVIIPWLLLAKNNDRQIEAQEEAASPRAAIPMKKLLRSPALWGTLVATFSYQYFNYFCMTWMPAYLVERRGLSLLAMSYYNGFSYGGMAVVATAAGWWADRRISRGGDPVKVRKYLSIAGLLVASTMVVGAFADSKAIALGFAVFSLSGLGLMTANYWALTQTLFPGGAVGRMVGIQNCAANIPGILAPIVTGWLKQTTGGYTAPMVTVAVLLLVGAAVYAKFVGREYVG